MSFNRRQFLGLGTLAASGMLLALPGCSQANPATADVAASRTFPFMLSDAQWRQRLSPAQYAVLRGHATERAFSSPLDREHRRGIFHCAGCQQALFDAATKFDSGTGWPSFYRALPNATGQDRDRSFGMLRVEVHCSNCGGHLGHLFNDGPRPTGLRYCMNGAALAFVAADDDGSGGWRVRR
ncbi:peptide-methionine (R)-S-oxide reductase MsrB [Stenotrophomonas sp. C3(2023)]|uniref:peptide-methionine (R)-S-oxide reductase MsrB n=1 Tax=Stenotrophomonas sp. C3(2023) TaxID=3080277 RepID=UPI00293C3F16|nr:peptide-methionine (R)-S-oxide reductase MsrB [Stenotrophomonas sp. C3(2023)]MDV3469713.1 peptide-methionine (R)-S-oxide reductase MsrB [Stenotrophomonas sp. C3(2023)]